MAGGAGSYVYRMGFRAEGICVWRRAEKVCGICGVADGRKPGRRVSNELFGVAGEFVPARGDFQGQNVANRGDRRVGDGPHRRGERVSAAYFWIRRNVARIGGLLPELSQPNGERGVAGQTDSAGV